MGLLIIIMRTTMIIVFRFARVLIFTILFKVFLKMKRQAINEISRNGIMVKLILSPIRKKIDAIVMIIKEAKYAAQPSLNTMLVDGKSKLIIGSPVKVRKTKTTKNSNIILKRSNINPHKKTK